MDQAIPVAALAGPLAALPVAPARAEGGGRYQEEEALVAALRCGDAGAFDELHRRLSPLMLAIALRYAGSRSLAEDIVQDTWLGVVQGIARFEGRSTLRTWILRILEYRARAARSKEGRSIPLSSLLKAGGDPQVLALSSDGAANLAPPAYRRSPEDQALRVEVGAELARALAALPARQRAVVLLRDVTGWSAPEVCAHLGVSAANQRVLLHRGRMQMRRALGSYAQP